MKVIFFFFWVVGLLVQSTEKVVNTSLGAEAVYVVYAVSDEGIDFL